VYKKEFIISIRSLDLEMFTSAEICPLKEFTIDSEK